MRRRAALLTLAGLPLVSRAARAADWSPRGRPISLIVPFAAGGTTDISARVLGAAIERELGAPVQVVNRPGATTQIGATELARARPDGHTLGLMSLPSLAMTYLDSERRAPYNRASFTPIAHFTSDANLLVVQAGSSFRGVADLVAAARAEARRVRIGTVGLMSNAHLPGVALERAAGVRFAFVHFNGGAPAITALLGGNVEAVINGSQTTIPQQRAGALRAIGTFAAERSSFFPETPTLREQGFDVSHPSAFALLGPAGLPAEVVTTLAAVTRRATEAEEVQRRMTDVALTVRYMDPAELAAFWADAEERQRPLIDLARQG
jgi:tripartite-type tricarboxylate transporter receptor subunit TctC